MAKSYLPVISVIERAQVKLAATELAKVLGETEHVVKTMLWRYIRVAGIEAAWLLFAQTQEIEAQGGMFTADGSRRRTIGGVFFSLARQQFKGQPAYSYIFPYALRPKALKVPALVQAPAVPFTWQDRQSAIDEAVSEPGGSTSVKVTLIGRPKKVIQRGDCFVMALPTMRIPSLPKGVPVPTEATQTQVLTYIGAKQWQRVAAAIEQPDDVLIVEGFGYYDPLIKGLALLATSVTTRQLQQAKRPPVTASDVSHPE